MAVIRIFIEGCESKAQHLFWEMINENVYDSRLRIVPCDGVSKIRGKLKDAENAIAKDDVVLVNLDNPLDNISVMKEIEKIADYIDKHGNFALISEKSFEDTILRFKYIEEWLYSKKYRDNGYQSDKNKVLLEHYLSFNKFFNECTKFNL